MLVPVLKERLVLKLGSLAPASVLGLHFFEADRPSEDGNFLLGGAPACLHMQPSMVKQASQGSGTRLHLPHHEMHLQRIHDNIHADMGYMRTLHNAVDCTQ